MESKHRLSPRAMGCSGLAGCQEAVAARSSAVEQILNLTSPQKFEDEAGTILKVHFHGLASLLNL